MAKRKTFCCNDVIDGCSFTIEAATEGELLQQVTKHAAHAHGITEVTPEVLSKVRSAIHEA